MTDLGPALRARGMRLTPQRRRIVEALAVLGHGTPDTIAAQVASDGGSALPLSTIYRGLEALEELGAVSHTHLTHGAPTYHLADHATHIHLVCLGCGAVCEVPAATAKTFAGNLRRLTGFDADVTHMAIQGWCQDCSRAGRTPTHTGSHSGTRAHPDSHEHAGSHQHTDSREHPESHEHLTGDPT